MADIVTPTTVLLVLRAARPNLRSLHDRCAFVVHSAVLSAGFHVVAAGQAALSDPPAGADEPEVGVDGWNEVEGVYAFRYKGGEGGLPNRLTMRCLAVSDLLIVDAVPEPLEPLSAPLHSEFSVNTFAVDTNSQNFADHFKDLEGLLALINKDILVPITRLPGVGRGGMKNEGDILRDRERPRVGPGEGFQPPPFLGDPMGGYRPPLFPGIGSDDLLPGGGGGGIFPPQRGGGGISIGGRGGGMLLGPNDPYWGQVGGRGGVPPFSGQDVPGIPPGARYDPIGPPGVPGFEPGRFMRGGRGNPNRPPGHPDLEYFRDD